MGLFGFGGAPGRTRTNPVGPFEFGSIIIRPMKRGMRIYASGVMQQAANNRFVAIAGTQKQ